jgi:uncharacterized protein YaeQ
MTDKTSIFKVRIDISNIDQHRYEQLCFTVGRGDEESMAHLVMRLIAFAMVPEDNMSFGHGVCGPAEPDVMVKDYDDHYIYWIDIGYPSVERVRRASHQADNVIIFSLNNSDWLKESGNTILNMNNIHLILLRPELIDKLAQGIQRNIKWSVVIDGDKIGISDTQNYVESTFTQLNSSHLNSQEAATI